MLSLGVALICCFSAVQFTGAYFAKEAALRQVLFSKYSKDVWPVSTSYGMQDVVQLSLNAVLTQIIDVAEHHQQVTVSMWLTMKWQTNNLIWNPQEYGNITRIRVPAGMVWRPDVILFSDVREEVANSDTTNVIIFSNGMVKWTQNVIYRSNCLLVLNDYPFDKQNCSFIFTSWAHAIDELNITVDNDMSEAPRFAEGKQWQLLSFSAQREVISDTNSNNTFIEIHYFLVIRRLPLFYIYHWIIPCVTIFLMCCASFLLPANSGEIISLSVNTMLAMSMFLLLAARRLPAQSQNIPLISVFFGSVMFLLAFVGATIVILLNINFHRTQTNNIPLWAVKLLFSSFFMKMFLPSSAMKMMQHSIKNENIIKVNGIRPKHKMCLTKPKKECQMSPHFLMDILSGLKYSSNTNSLEKTLWSLIVIGLTRMSLTLFMSSTILLSCGFVIKVIVTY